MTPTLPSETVSAPISAVAGEFTRGAIGALPGCLPDVLIIGEFPFPTGSPGANVLRGHCAAIREAGFSAGLLPSQGLGREEDMQADGGYRFRGLPYWPLYQPKRLSRFQKYIYSVVQQPDARLNWLSQSSLAGVKTILVYPGSQAVVPFIRALQRVQARHPGVRLFTYAVEWHALRQFRGLYGCIEAACLDYLRRVVNPSLDGVICISSFLHDHYNSRGCRSVLIPPLLDLSDPSWQHTTPCETNYPHRPLRLLFSGSASRDRHDIILRSLKRLRDQGRQIVLEYAGPSREELAALPGVGMKLIQSLGDGLLFHGRLKGARVHAVASQADFGLLLRDDARWSRACFPSKVPEFFALGVPMLCNLTSDLGRYLRDGENALVVKETSVDSFSATLDCALKLDENGMFALKTAARRTAELFDGSRYAEQYRAFLR